MARALASDMVTWFNEAKTLRAPNENDWRLAAAYVDPANYHGWQTDGQPSFDASGLAQTRRMNYDSTGALALDKYKAVLERIATPHTMRWQGFAPSDKNLLKSTRVKRYFDDLTQLVFDMRYQTRANFRRSVSEVYGSLGAYGTGPIFYGQRQPNALYTGPSLLYKSINLRDIYILVNDDGEVVMVFRRFWLNPRQFKEKWPQQEYPPCMAHLAKGDVKPKETDYKEFFHVVMPRNDHDPFALDARRHAIVSSYVCVADQCYIGEEQGFRSMPYLTPRTSTQAGNPYGFAPAARVLASLGGASAMKKTIIRQSQKATDPVLLAFDDGVMNAGIDQRPGAINYGGVDKQGRELIKAMPVGNLAVGKDSLEDERRNINDSFFVTLFQILIETPEMTATEVVERSAEKSALLSPTMGAIQSELLGPGTEREIDILIEMGKVSDGDGSPGLEMPPELKEAKGEYTIIYTSPMAKAMNAEETSGFMRVVEMSLNIAQQTQDPSVLDHFNFNVAIPEIANNQAVPSRWMNDETERQALAENRNKQQQQQDLLKNAAPIAGAMKTAQQMQEGTPAK